MEPKGRVGLGRGGSTRTSIGMEPILDQQGNTSSPSERTFSAPYIVTAMRGIQLCCGSSQYSCRLSGLIPRQYPSARDAAPAPNPSEIEIPPAGMFNAVNFSDNVEMIVGALDPSARQKSCGPGSGGRDEPLPKKVNACGKVRRLAYDATLLCLS